MRGLKRAYIKQPIKVIDEQSSSADRYNYSVLAANLYSQMMNSELKCVSVLGMNKNDGSGEVAINIAKQLKSAGKKVLYVDCNLLTSNLSTIITPPNSEADDVIDMIQYEKLVDCDVIFAEQLLGKFSTPQINEKQMTELVDILKPQYEVVIFDLPCIAENISSVMAAKCTDGAFLVINKLLTKKKQFEHIMTSIAHTNLHIIGSAFVEVI